MDKNDSPNLDETEEEEGIPNIMNLTITNIAEDAVERERARQTAMNASQPIASTSRALREALEVTQATDAEIPRSRADVRRAYSTLIEKCQGFENKDTDLEKLLSENVAKGAELFKEIGGSPSDMYMAFLHTQECSGMLKLSVAEMGNSSSRFSPNFFIECTKAFSVDCLEGTENGNEYSPGAGLAAISLLASECHWTLPRMVAMIGAYDRGQVEGPPKPKKPRAAYTRKVFDVTFAKATQHEVLKARVGRSLEKTRAEVITQQMMRVLKRYHETETGRGAELFNFTQITTSLAATVENLFYVGFLVRDGLAALGHMPGPQKERKLANLMILPAKPPSATVAAPSAASANRAGPSKKKAKLEKEDKKKTDERPRNQCIISFSPRMFNAMVKSGHGEDFLRAFRQPGPVAIRKPRPK